MLSCSCFKLQYPQRDLLCGSGSEGQQGLDVGNQLRM